MAGNSADRPAPFGRRATEENVRVFLRQSTRAYSDFGASFVLCLGCARFCFCCVNVFAVFQDFKLFEVWGCVRCFRLLRCARLLRFEVCGFRDLFVCVWTVLRVDIFRLPFVLFFWGLLFSSVVLQRYRPLLLLLPLLHLLLLLLLH